MSGCSKIRHIVRIRQMLRRWRKKAASRAPFDVPAGHMAIAVGPTCKRFVVRTTYLNHPLFKKLLIQAEEEYGFTNTGPLAIPCNESLFEEILCYLARSESSLTNSARFMTFEDFQTLGFRTNIDIWADSRPLLHAASHNSFW